MTDIKVGKMKKIVALLALVVLISGCATPRLSNVSGDIYRVSKYGGTVWADIFGLKMAVYQKSFLTHGYPEVHAWVFDVKTGKLMDLNIDFFKIIESTKDIYDLGTND